MVPSRSLGALALGLICLVFTGCSTTSFGIGQWGSDPSLSEQRFATSKKKLKDPVKLHLKYARWQEHIGNLSEARDSYEFILSEEPETVDAVLGLARVDQLSGRTHEAEQGFQKALKLDPNNAQALQGAGQFYASEQRWGESLRLLRAATAADPNDRAIRFSLAVVLASSGDTDGALAEFTRAVGEAEAHYNVGLVLYEQGDESASEQHFAQALMINPQMEEAQYWLSEIRGDDDPETAVAENQRDMRVEELPPPHAGGHTTAMSAPNPRRNSHIRQAGATRAAGARVPRSRVQPAHHERTRNRSVQTSVPAARSSQRPIITAREHSTRTTDSPQTDTRAPQASWTSRQAPPEGLSPEQREQWQNQRRASLQR